MFAGKEVLEMLNELGTTEGRTKKKVTIYDCGVVSHKWEICHMLLCELSIWHPTLICYLILFICFFISWWWHYKRDTAHSCVRSPLQYILFLAFVSSGWYCVYNECHTMVWLCGVIDIMIILPICFYMRWIDKFYHHPWGANMPELIYGTSADDKTKAYIYRERGDWPMFFLSMAPNHNGPKATWLKHVRCKNLTISTE